MVIPYDFQQVEVVDGMLGLAGCVGLVQAVPNDNVVDVSIGLVALGLDGFLHIAAIG
jgi:hypothetical protein